MKILRKKYHVILTLSLLLGGCGYKLGDLEVIGENSSKTASLNVISSKKIIQKFKNSGFKVNQDKFEYLVKVEGPFNNKATSSVTSSAEDKEFTLTATLIISIYNKAGEQIIERKILSKSREYDFSSSNINSSENEERIIFEDLEKTLYVEMLNILRSLI